MAISAGRLTQMISVLNPVLTRNAAGEMTEEWVSCGKIHADISGTGSRELMQYGADLAQAEIRIRGLGGSWPRFLSRSATDDAKRCVSILQRHRRH
ncbi:head-tail adaptor protein, partial [Escherichia coli]